jgi:hypothetical protein
VARLFLEKGGRAMEIAQVTKEMVIENVEKIVRKMEEDPPYGWEYGTVSQLVALYERKHIEIVDNAQILKQQTMEKLRKYVKIKGIKILIPLLILLLVYPLPTCDETCRSIIEAGIVILIGTGGIAIIRLLQEAYTELSQIHDTVKESTLTLLVLYNWRVQKGYFPPSQSAGIVPEELLKELEKTLFEMVEKTIENIVIQKEERYLRAISNST